MKYTISVADRSSPLYIDQGFLEGKKVAVIKAIRSITDIGLSEAKDLSENLELYDIVLESRTGANAKNRIEAGLEVLRLLDVQIEQQGAAPLILLKEVVLAALEEDNITLARQALELYEEHAS